MTTTWRDKAALPIREAAEVMSLGKDSVYKLVRDGEIRAVKVGTRTLVPVQEIERFLGIERPQTPATPEEIGLAVLKLVANQAAAS